MLQFLLRHKNFIILTTLLILSFTLFTREIERKKSFGFFENLFVRIFSLPLNFSTVCLKKFNKIWHGYFYLVNIRKENEYLKDLLSKILLENQRLREEAIENKRLRELLSFKKSIPDTLIPAEIIGRDPSSWFRTLLINKGTKDGITSHTAVVTSKGAVGQIISAGEHISKVLLITDSDSAIDSMIQNSRVRGILEGKIENLCKLDYISKTEEIKVGDIVITTGLNGIFPKGIVIGKVSHVEKNKKGFFQYIEVKPAVDFTKLEEVLVVLKKIEINDK